nr:phospholipase-like, aminotransferase-like mobile domain protein [Tanacetum cinerariifolium]
MIYVRSKLRLFQLFKDRLNEDHRTLFKTTCFGPWLDIIYVKNDDDGMIHYVLQKQCCSDDDNFDLPLIYYVNGHSLHFGRRQFCLLTGFKFGSISFREYRNGNIPFRNRLFPEKIGYDVKIIDLFALFYDEEKFSKLNMDNRVFLCIGLLVDQSARNHTKSIVMEEKDMDNRVFLCIGSLVDQSARNHTKSIVMEEKARAAKKKSSKDSHPSEGVREASLIDRVCDLESICETLSTLPKEKVVPQSEDYLQSTSEDEPDIKDHTSLKEDDDSSSDLSVLNGFFNNLSQTGEEKGDCEHYKYTYSSKQEDQIIRLVDQRQHDYISNMAEVAEQKIHFEIQRLYKHNEARLNKIAEEDKQRKCLGHMNSSAHMKLAIECCVPKKRKYVDVLRVVVGRCKFPLYNDIIVDRSFWNVLSALDDNRKGWLLDETDMD